MSEEMMLEQVPLEQIKSVVEKQAKREAARRPARVQTKKEPEKRVLTRKRRQLGRMK